MIIHIAGSSGSGKTTLAEKLKKIYENKIVVYDTDDIIQPNSKELELLIKAKNYRKVYLQILQKFIKNYIKEHKDKIIIFVGLTRQSLNDPEPPNIYYIKEANYNFFLDISIEVLLERYYNRLCNNLSKATKTELDKYWKEVGDGHYYILGTKDIIENNKENITLHKKNGYKIVKYEDILKFIEEIYMKKK
jgi:adenylate kinase family enzyme